MATKIITDSIFARNLRRIRTSKKLTQEQVVIKLNILGSPLSRSTYSIIEAGKGNIFISDLVALQQIFDVEYSEFFLGIEPKR